MNIKKMFIFPAIAMLLLVIAMIVGVAAGARDETGVYDTLISISCLVPLCLHVIALVGSLKNSKSMVLIGSAIVLFVSFIGNIIMASYGTSAVAGASPSTARILTSMTWTFFTMTCFVAIVLMVSGFVAIGSKGGNTFMLVAAILAIVFFFGLFIFSLIDFLVGSKDNSLYALYSVFFGLSVLVVVGSMLAVSIMGIQGGEEDEVQEQPGLTHTPKSLKLSKDGGADELLKWKELYDKGALTEQEYQEKKDEILNR